MDTITINELLEDFPDRPIIDIRNGWKFHNPEIAPHRFSIFPSEILGRTDDKGIIYFNDAEPKLIVIAAYQFLKTMLMAQLRYVSQSQLEGLSRRLKDHKAEAGYASDLGQRIMDSENIVRLLLQLNNYKPAEVQ
jgi:hypothetical protein